MTEHDDRATRDDRHPGQPSEAGRKEEDVGGSGIYPPGTGAPENAEKRTPGEWAERTSAAGKEGQETVEETLPVKRETIQGREAVEQREERGEGAG